MAFVIRGGVAGTPLIVFGRQPRQNDDADSRRIAKTILQADLSQKWLARDSSGLQLHYSYSHLADQTWAAATDPSCLIGIDAVSDSEFAGEYPLHKVFHDGEIATGRPARIWSAKEAVAKALGCGFDGMNPLDIRMRGFTIATVANSVALQIWSGQQPDGVWVSVAYGYSASRQKKTR